MKNKISKSIVCICFLFLSSFTMSAQYKETMSKNGFSVNLKDDYGLKNDNAAKPQGQLLQKVIDDVSSKKAGGNIFIPKGVYDIAGISLKSNVHILIEEGTVIMPKKESGGAKGPKKDKKDPKAKKASKSSDDKGTVFKFDAEDIKGKGKGKNNGEQEPYIENVSVRGVGGPFIIDYHFLKSGDRQRAFTVKMVKNFLIENVDIKDNYTVYCGTSFGPSSSKADVSKWEVSRPTDGLIRNYRHFKGSPGYGAIQCHGGQTVHFENIYSLGGVAFRLEVGADNKNVGVYDMTAKNIICEDGRVAVMLGPHSAKNGVVTVDGVTTIGCVSAVTMGDGHVKANAPDQTPGWFDSNSSVKNIHAVYGENAQIRGDHIGQYRKPEFLEGIKIWSDSKFFSAPSLNVVSDQPNKYKVKIENVTWSGFPFDPSDLSSKPESHNDFSTKKQWEVTHKGIQWKSDKGVVNDDYEIESVKDMNVRIKKLVAKK